MLIKKSLVGAGLWIAAALGACNLSTQLTANEVALNPSSLEVSPTPTLALSPFPTRTPIGDVAPTLVVLDRADVTALPVSQSSGVAVPPTQPPPEGGCSLKATGNFDVNVRTGPGTEYKIMSALPAGQYMLVINQSENGWYQIPWGREAVGWVSPKVVTLYGPCDALIAQWAADRAQPPTLTPTPTAMFGANIGSPQNNIVTKVAIGSIPAGTIVIINSAMFTGSGYIYDIMTVDGRFEKATDEQLMFSSGGGLMPFPTPTAYVNVATPRAAFQSEIGIRQYRVVTTVQLGSVPAGTTVRIRSAFYNGTIWIYDVWTEDGRTFTAGESQLTYIPNAGGGGPTPDIPATPTATVPVMDLPTDVSPSDVVIPDDLCTVTATSKTNLYAFPKPSTAVVGILNPGPWAQVSAIDTGGWYKVTIWTDGRQGWGSSSTLTLHGMCDAVPRQGGG